MAGAKFKANASKHKAMSWQRACQLEDQLSQEVAELLEKAKAADQAAEDHHHLPEELERRRERLAKVQQAKAEIQERAARRYEQEQAEYQQKMTERAEKEKKTGKKTPGPKPEPPEPEPTGKDQVNFTDAESRIMLTSEHGWQQASSAESAVDYG